eukprot:6233833-Amphidinium_carterae.1
MLRIRACLDSSKTQPPQARRRFQTRSRRVAPNEAKTVKRPQHGEHSSAMRSQACLQLANLMERLARNRSGRNRFTPTPGGGPQPNRTANSPTAWAWHTKTSPQSDDKPCVAREVFFRDWAESPWPGRTSHRTSTSVRCGLLEALGLAAVFRPDGLGSGQEVTNIVNNYEPTTNHY